MGASLRETGSRPTGQAAARPVASRFDPARKGFAAEYPHLSGCLHNLVWLGLGYGAMALLAGFAGMVAAFWFGLGFLVASLFAMWEAGNKAIAIEAATAGETAKTGSTRSAKARAGTASPESPSR